MHRLGSIIAALAALTMPRNCKSLLLEHVLFARLHKASPVFGRIPVAVRVTSRRFRGRPAWRG